MIQPWQQIRTRALADYRIFKVRADLKINPRTGQEHDFIILECRDWVNVVALTPNEELVMVEQFRHGSNTVELEVPGGIKDAEDTSPVATGIRELREETGYEGEGAQLFGGVFANPAILTNTCHTVFIRNCRLQHPLELDSGEDLVTRLVPVTEVPALINAGRIRHPLVVVALYYFDLWRQGHWTPQVDESER